MLQQLIQQRRTNVRNECVLHISRPSKNYIYTTKHRIRPVHTRAPSSSSSLFGQEDDARRNIQVYIQNDDEDADFLFQLCSLRCWPTTGEQAMARSNQIHVDAQCELIIGHGLRIIFVCRYCSGNAIILFCLMFSILTTSHTTTAAVIQLTYLNILYIL